MFRTLLLSALFIAASATNLRTEGRSTGHNHEGESLQHSGWSLLSEKGENVLAEQSTSRRLTAYRNLHLKFEALNLRFGVRLDQASSVFHDETIVTVHSKEPVQTVDEQTYKKEIPIHELQDPRSYLSPDRTASLTFLKPGQISGVLIQHNKTLTITASANKVDIHESHSVACGVSERHKASKNLHRRRTVDLWTNCYVGDTIAHRIYVGIGVGEELFKNKLSSDINEAKALIQSVIAQVNLVYHKQMNIVITVRAINIVEGSAIDPPRWNNRDCSESLNTQLDNLASWEPDSEQGLWHVFDDCWEGGSIGLAWIGTLCQPYNFGFYRNTAVSWHSDLLWTTAAHEFGHNFGADHSFENGQGTTGGLMDYGDGLYNGEYQFNPLRKSEICTEINSVIQQCPYIDDYVPICGDRILDEGETCECADGSISCRYCNNCRLDAGRDCTPDSSTDVGCCTMTGKFATSIDCEVAQEKGYCNRGVCESTYYPCTYYGFGSFCGTHTNGCRVSCEYQGVCNDLEQYSRPTFEEQIVKDGTLCTTSQGKPGSCNYGTCIELPVVVGPIDCSGFWEVTGDCSTTCGDGVRSRRFVVDQPAENGGSDCTDPADGETDFQACRADISCPVDCDGSWSNWGECSATCGSGSRTQTFKIQLFASNGGVSCPASDGNIKSKDCTTSISCQGSVDCQGDWSSWTICDASCGGGVQRRSYFHTKEAENGGDQCAIDKGAIETAECNNDACPIDCVGSWGEYNDCSVTCGGGKVTRQYSVTVPAASGGKPCSSNDGAIESQTCKSGALCDYEDIDGCTQYSGKWWVGLSNVPGGSTSSGGYSLDQCNQACLDQAACRSFVVNKETGVCELWDQSRLASALTESAVHSAFICPERGYNSTVSYLCSNKYAGKNFPEADHIAEFTELSFYECDTKCQERNDCYSFSVGVSTSTLGHCVLNANPTLANLRIDLTMDTYICNVGVTKAATTTSTDMQISCPLPSAFMDGTCNDMNNIADCNWDGGDCCGRSIVDTYCNQCQCLDPDFIPTKCTNTDNGKTVFGVYTCADFELGDYTKTYCIAAVDNDFIPTELCCACPPGGSTEQVPVVLGCTDRTACNYNPSANKDDGNCVAQPEGNYNCNGDCKPEVVDACGKCDGSTCNVQLCTDPSSYVGDGYCDMGSNWASCDFDGGDCCDRNRNLNYCTTGDWRCACLDDEFCAAQSLEVCSRAGCKIVNNQCVSYSDTIPETTSIAPTVTNGQPTSAPVSERALCPILTEDECRLAAIAKGLSPGVTGWPFAAESNSGTVYPKGCHFYVLYNNAYFGIGGTPEQMSTATIPSNEWGGIERILHECPTTVLSSTTTAISDAGTTSIKYTTPKPQTPIAVSTNKSSTSKPSPKQSTLDTTTQPSSIRSTIALDTADDIITSTVTNRDPNVCDSEGFESGYCLIFWSDVDKGTCEAVVGDFDQAKAIKEEFIAIVEQDHSSAFQSALLPPVSLATAHIWFNMFWFGAQSDNTDSALLSTIGINLTVNGEKTLFFSVSSQDFNPPENVNFITGLGVDDQLTTMIIAAVASVAVLLIVIILIVAVVHGKRKTSKNEKHGTVDNDPGNIQDTYDDYSTSMGTRHNTFSN